MKNSKIKQSVFDTMKVKVLDLEEWISDIIQRTKPHEGRHTIELDVLDNKFLFCKKLNEMFMMHETGDKINE